MADIKIAAAQCIAAKGDIAANTALHQKFITAAHRAGVQLLVFPELSLSGYELPLLAQCVVHPEDACLAGIRQTVSQTQITVVIGAPVAGPDGKPPAIGAITFYPDASYSVYRKQHLHPGEEVYATPGDITSTHKDLLHGAPYSLAICADTAHESHAAKAAKHGATLYLAGVLISENGYDADSTQLRNYATKLNMGVLIANHGGPSGGYVSAGKSAFWAPGGRLVAQVPGIGNSLLIATQRQGAWSGEILEID